MPLKLETEASADGVLLIVAEGEIDANTFEYLEATLTDGVEGGRARIVLDLSGVAFVSSSGIGILIGAMSEAKAKDGDLILVAPNDAVQDVFDGMGFSSMFTIAKTRAEAMEAFSE